MSQTTVWDHNLDVLEAMIEHTPRGVQFLTAHGLLFAAIVWLQTGIVHLLAVKWSHDKCPSLSPTALGRDDALVVQRAETLLPELGQLYTWDFSKVAREFQCCFRPAVEVATLLPAWCVCATCWRTRCC